MSQAATWIPPQEFDEYHLVRPLGAGGMGQVFLAHDLVLDRLVAIKFIGTLEPDADARDRFLNEARAAARLQHPNVVAVYRIGEIDHKPFIVSEYLRGKSLAELARPLPWRRVLELGVELARGLAAAHHEGVLHRDIKPSNAVLTEHGTVKLLDFGLAKLIDQQVSATAGAASLAPPPVAAAAWVKAQALPALALEPTTTGSLPSGLVVIPAERSAISPYLDGPSDPRLPTLILPVGPPALDEGGAPVSSPSEVTRAGTVMGTPHYMSPEQWRGEPCTRRSDVYSLGALLHELLAGSPPHDDGSEPSLGELSRRVQADNLPGVASRVPGIDERFATVVDLCLRLDPEERFASAEELRDALEQLLAHPEAPADGGDEDPYRGLAAFEAKHRGVFFGRARESRAILERLRSTGFVLLAGDSGVGKSSVCRASVLPLVEEGALADGRLWRIATLAPGRHPVQQLAAALAPTLGRTQDAVAELLFEGASPVVRALRGVLRDERGLLLFIDQLEELVTLAADREGAVAASLLAEIAGGAAGVRALATVRGDFLTGLAALPGFADEVNRAFFLLGPLAPDGVRQAVVGPALARGVRFESTALVDTLVSSATVDGGLPLLQFALAELWRKRNVEQKLIEAAALDAMGGVAGALARHADEVISALLPAQRAVARRLLVRLVTAEGTRARRSEADLAIEPRASEVLSALVRGRLVLVRHGGEEDGSDATTYELAHEALLTGWATLRRWLDRNAGARAMAQRLEVAAADWSRLGRASDALWRDRQLAEAAAVDVDDLPPQVAAFLRAARARARRARVLRLAGLIGVPLMVAVVWLGVTFEARREREAEHARAALVLRTRVDSLMASAHDWTVQADASEREADRLRDEAYRAFDANDPERGETVWAQARRAGEQTDRASAAAEQQLERAFSEDATRADVRAALADALLRRALLADAEQRRGQRDELLARLTLYDDGSRRARFDAEASLTLEVEPADAEMVVARYEPDERGKLRLAPLPGPEGRALRLPPGSYLVTLTAAGRAQVRVPALLARADDQRVSIALPPAASVPPGFVFVPSGRFLHGSVEEGLRKSFFRAPPLHPVEVRAFLIARDETTFADWIAWLETLPRTERARRTPGVSVSVGFRGGLALDELATGEWRLAIAPTEKRYVARAGEALHYEGRKTGATQDWLRAPVAGISAEDARAYAAWLASSGRVPGARLCSELEWERAARGADGRSYPHGDTLAPTDANFDETHGKQPLGFGPDAVGSYGVSDSPFGVHDMAGNVWELTTSADAKGIVAKGGGFYSDVVSIQVANRELPEESYRDATVGLRICADVR